MPSIVAILAPESTHRRKREIPAATLAMFAAHDNFCGETRVPSTGREKRAAAAVMAGIAGHVWSFGELF